MKHHIFLFIILVSLQTYAQNSAISPNEKLIYTISYNMSGILTDIAQVTMETSEVKTSKSTLLRLKCTAATYSKWDSFFKIRDLYESYVNPNTLTPYLYNRDISEGGYYKFMQYKYDHKSKTIKSLKRKKRKDGVTWDENRIFKFGASTKDIVSTLYSVRNLDIHKAKPGDQKDFVIVIDNKESTISIRYIGKETISTKLGEKSCYKLAISTKSNDFIKGKNSNILWLTEDKNKIPVYATFKIPVGNGELRIVSATGLKN